MCGTCGCGENLDVITITLLGDKVKNEEKEMVENYFLKNDHHHHYGKVHHHHHGNSLGHAHETEHDHTHEHLSSKVIQVEQDILHQNDLLAERNRGYFEAKNIVAFNLVSSPGSGKTSLLEHTLDTLKDQFHFSVIEGDQQTLNDANRIARLEIPVVQINTGKACHLDAAMVIRAVKKLNPKSDSILFIENVGNLVCPAMFDLGETKRVVIMSVTEGEDKAIKYPDMFHSAHLCIINKIDLLPYVDFNVEKAKAYAMQVNHHLEFIELSATKGTGIEQWYNWIAKNKRI